VHKAALFAITAALLLHRKSYPELGIGEFTEESPGSSLKDADFMRDF